MRPEAFLAQTQNSPVVQREQARVASAGHEGVGVPKEEYGDLKVGILVENELKHIALME
jgi:hypothetical protein